MITSIYLKDYVQPNCDILRGGKDDCAEKIQRVLDMAKEGDGIRVIVEGAYYTSTLKIHSHTTIECLNRNCGFYLADGTTDALFANADFSTEDISDEDIHFIGGSYNLNCAGQEHHREDFARCGNPVFDEGFLGSSMGFKFMGVRDFSMKDAVIINQRTYAMAFANWENVVMEDIRIELPLCMFGQNQDGLHFFGKGRFLTLRNICGTAGDDFIALAPDELDGVSDITDVLIDGVFLKESDQAIRLLSRGKGRLDRVIIKNVTGTYKSYGFFINPWCNPFYGDGINCGDYGTIQIENVHLKQVIGKYDYTKPCLFRLGGKIGTLKLRDVVFENRDDDSDFMQIGGDYIFWNKDVNGECFTEVDTITMNGIHILKNDDDKAETSGVILKALCRNVVISDSVSDVTLISGGNENGKIGNLVASNVIVKGKLIDNIQIGNKSSVNVLEK
ncbi:MAG: hypothetical protein ACI4S9_07680 [Christensenellales bacterium]